LGVAALAIILLWIIWAINKYILLSIAESYASELSIYIPLNRQLLKSITYVIFILLIPVAALIFSLRRRRRLYGLLLATVLSITYYAILGAAAFNFRIDPITSAPLKCFVLHNGEIKLWDYVSGAERRLDPYTGKPCNPVTPENAPMIDRWERGIRPKPIPDGSMPEMFDGAIGTPRVWYSRSANGKLELFDSAGFHPFTNEPLKPVTPDVSGEWQKQNSMLQIEIEAENRRREEEVGRQRESGIKCDRLAGNRYDDRRNISVPGVPYQLLRTNASLAVAACHDAIAINPNELRYEYQLARALQAQQSSEARQLLQKLTQQNYAAAFDNLGWIYYSEQQVHQAISYFEHGASLGSSEAMVSLARFLIDGRWIRKDERRAQELLKSAATQGHDEASEAVRQYEQRQRAGAIGGALLGAILGEILKTNR
ncbi:unnamed protein product, partial [Ectocarpus fasciculatus]